MRSDDYNHWLFLRKNKYFVSVEHGMARKSVLLWMKLKGIRNPLAVLITSSKSRQGMIRQS